MDCFSKIERLGLKFCPVFGAIEVADTVPGLNKVNEAGGSVLRRLRAPWCFKIWKFSEVFEGLPAFQKVYESWKSKGTPAMPPRPPPRKKAY